MRPTRLDQARSLLKRAWRFIWHDDSALAWIANLLLAFVIIKWVFYPLIGLMMGTSLPIVAVVSGSMDHAPTDGMLCGQQVLKDADFWETCGSWYEERGITQEEFADFPLGGGFSKGDIVVLRGKDPGEVQIGDVLVFQARKPYPIIHRVINASTDGETTVLQTRGDHNPTQIEEYALSDGRYFYQCFQELGQGIYPSLCGPGARRVEASTPGAIKILDERSITEDEVIGTALFRIPWVGYVKILMVDALSGLGIGSSTEAL